MKYHLLTVIVALSAVLIIHVIPMDAHAEVKSFTLAKPTYDTDVDETFTIVGNIAADRQSVYVIIRDSIGNHRGLLASPTTDADGSFTTIPKKINSIFKSDGWYNATAFTAAQKEEDGRTMQIKFENGLLFTIPDFTLKIQEIPDQRVNEGDVLSFVVGVTDRSIEDVRYRLGDVIQQGATINESTGEFRWTPGFDKGTTGGAMYSFEVVASKPPLEDKRNFMVIVFNQAVATPAAPESSESNDVPTGTTTTSATSATTPTTTSTPTLDVLEIPAPFVDEGTDPQVYVDRYNDEPAFREWFDVTYAGEYGSIYNAVGLPEIPAPFVDEGTDPQVYVDRYNDEPAFREWFDANYPAYDSIHHAVGLADRAVAVAVAGGGVDVDDDDNNEGDNGVDSIDGLDNEYDNGRDGVRPATAPFVDEGTDPQVYVDRYNNEPAFREWFDITYAGEYDSIYDAVGLPDPAAGHDDGVDYNGSDDNGGDALPDPTHEEVNDLLVDVTEGSSSGSSSSSATTGNDGSIVPPPGVTLEPWEEYGECGEGTELVDGYCMIIYDQFYDDDSNGAGNVDGDGGGCLIATATYGTELAPQVQFLREIRDGHLLQTQSGSSFMAGFNSLYYTFSPHIADYERENSLFREAVKAGITPLLHTLVIMEHADSEEKVLGYGIGTILLNLAIYMGSPAALIVVLFRYGRRLGVRSQIRAGAAL